MASSAGQQLIAGRIPGEEIASDAATSNSSNFTTTEVTVHSVTAPLVEGRTYQVIADAQFASNQDDDLVIARIREDDVNGAQLRDHYVRIRGAGSTARGFSVYITAEYTATATGNKTFVLTADRLLGSGTCFMEASADNPAFMKVNYLRG